METKLFRDTVMQPRPNQEVMPGRKTTGYLWKTKELKVPESGEKL